MAEFYSMPLATDAYLADTIHLTTIEHGAYLLLLMCMWRNGGALPNDDKILARYARLGPGQWKRVKPTVFKFFQIVNDEVVQQRLTKEYNAAKRRSESARNNAKSKSLKSNDDDGADARDPPNDSSAPITTIITDKEKEIDKSISKKTDTEEFRIAVAAYNGLAKKHDLSQVQSLTDTRRKKLRQRLKECGGLDGWSVALEKIGESAFLLGNNDKGWAANFDFILQASSFTKIMEGAYNAKTPSDTAESSLEQFASDLAEQHIQLFGECSQDAGPVGGEPQGSWQNQGNAARTDCDSIEGSVGIPGTVGYESN